MEFTVGILIYSISLDTTIYTNIAEDRDYILERYEIWENGLPDTETVYLMSAEQLMQDPAMWKNRTVLFTGKAADTEAISEVRWICVSGRISLKELALMVQKAFRRFFECGYRIQKLISSRKSINHVLTGLEDFYQIYSCIATKTLRIFARSKRFREVNSWINDKDEVTFRTASDLVMDSDFQNAGQFDEAFPYLNADGEWYYCYNFKINGIYQMRLICCVADHRKYHGMQKLVELLGSCIDEVFEKYIYYEESPQNQQDFHSFLKTMLEGKRVSEGELRSMLDIRQWKEEQEYQVILFKYHELAGKGMGMAYHRAQLHRLFGDCYVIEETSPFVCIRNLSRSGERREGYKEELPYFLREALCKASFSSTFRGFSQLYDYYMEAEAAMQIGEHVDPTQWSYHFPDFRFEFMLEQCTGVLKSAQLLHPAFSVLQEYDAMNDTELVRTLEVFLQENHNLAHTARRLDIHRTTLLARLERIDKLTQADLTDYRTCLHLMLSFELLEKKKGM